MSSALVAIVAIIVTFLSLSPASPDSSGGMPLLRMAAKMLVGDPEAYDKIGHFLAYAALAFVSLLRWPRRLLPVIVLATAYGGLMEIGQLFVPLRTATWSDLLADGLGALAGSAAYLTLRTTTSGLLPWPSR
ncbi:VanZ family protein [Parvularcula maris]|uniref:VanZ family protein n=1 Tax=Parvularcula maris TaxID=2965077 RepID=UPI00211569F9|nr:VanZ family protein [Parvularcula maris]